jgi:hypothetical protein
MDGHPRTSRRDRASYHGPLPTMADTRLVIRTYVKQYPLQAGPGQLVGMAPSQAHTWIHLLHRVLHHA